MDIINPATDQIIKSLNADTTKSVSEKFEQLKIGQKKWQAQTIKMRIDCLAKFCDVLKKNADQFAHEMTLETGKPISQAKNEVNGGIKRIQFFLENGSKILAQSKVNQDGNTTEEIGYDPLGVIVNISAWNYPLLVAINVFVPALIAGNAILYKPSEFATLTGLNIEKYLFEAGVPRDVFNCIVGDGKLGAALLELKIDGVFFTGSYKTGVAIAKSVAAKLIPVGLELGGKDPLYATEEVSDVKAVAQAAVEGAFYNNGQSCCAVERVYVHEKIYDEFVKYFIEETKKLKVGNPLENVDQGAITRKQHLAFLKEQVSEAVKLGAKLELGGNIIQGAGAFFEPTVLTNVNHKMQIMSEESFGPVIGIMKVKNDQEAIDLMNDSQYGLTSAVYCSNEDRGREILSQINSGTGYLNCCDRVSGYLPWSGRGNSGLGSTLSHLGIYAFCSPKAWHIRS